MLPDLGSLGVLFAFWVFYPAIALVILMLTLVAYEKSGGYFTIAILAFLLILQFLGKIPIFQFIGDHPIWTLVFFVLYFPVGILYSRYYELPRLCRRVVEEYNSKKQAFFKNWTPTGNNKDKTVEEGWIVQCRFSYPQFVDGKFSVRSYKGKILTWVTYWPWFLLWRLVHDFLKDIWDVIYLKIQHIYQSVADRIYKDILTDLSQDKK